MTYYLRNQVTESALIASGHGHAVTFQPRDGGTVTVIVDPLQPPSSGEVTYLAQIEFRKPDHSLSGLPFRVPYKGPFPFQVSYQTPATGATSQGPWSCVVRNFADQDVTFDLTISYETSTELAPHTVTFDVVLLETMVGNAVTAAELKVHLQSSQDPAATLSALSWGYAVTQLVRQTNYAFALPDYRLEHHFAVGTLTWAVVEIESFDFGPGGVTVLVGNDNGVPTIEVVVAVDGSTAALKVVDSDLDIDDADIDATVSASTLVVSMDFYGNGLTVTGTVSAELTVAGVRVAEIDDGPIGDLGDISKKASSMLGAGTIRRYIDEFFADLLRLPPQSQIHAYRIDTAGSVLSVDFLSPVTHNSPVDKGAITATHTTTAVKSAGSKTVSTAHSIGTTTHSGNLP